MKEKNNKISFWLIVLSFATIVLVMAFKIGAIVTFKLVSSFVFLFILPGLIWSFVFWPKPIDSVLRIVFSVAFSIIFVPLIEFYLNRFSHLPITGPNVLYIVLSISFLGLLIYSSYFFRQICHRKLNNSKKSL